MLKVILSSRLITITISTLLSNTNLLVTGSLLFITLLISLLLIILLSFLYLHTSIYFLLFVLNHIVLLFQRFWAYCNSNLLRTRYISFLLFYLLILDINNLLLSFLLLKYYLILSFHTPRSSM